MASIGQLDHRCSGRVHEIAHLFLGHLGVDSALHVPYRGVLSKNDLEIEAEAVAYIVCVRNGVTPKSQTYLASYVNAKIDGGTINVYEVARAAGQIESLLGLAGHTVFDRIANGTRELKSATG